MTADTMPARQDPGCANIRPPAVARLGKQHRTWQMVQSGLPQTEKPIGQTRGYNREHHKQDRQDTFRFHVVEGWRATAEQSTTSPSQARRILDPAADRREEAIMAPPEKLARALLLSLVCLAGPYCDSTTDTADLESERALYLAVTRNTDVRTTCEAAMTSALSCATSAGTISVTFLGVSTSTAATSYYPSYMETIYSFSAAAPKGATEMCDQLVTAANYPVPGKTNSEGARICYLQCEKDVWDRAIAASRCTSTGYLDFTATAAINGLTTTVISLTRDGFYQQCLEDCLVRGTVLPD